MKRLLMLAFATLSLAACQNSNSGAPVQTPITDVTPACLSGRHFEDRDHLCRDLRLEQRNGDTCSSADRYAYFQVKCADYSWQGSAHDPQPQPQPPHHPRSHERDHDHVDAVIETE